MGKRTKVGVNNQKGFKKRKVGLGEILVKRKFKWRLWIWGGSSENRTY